MADQLTQEYGYPVKVNYSSSRGYHLNIPSEVDNLPPIFIQAVQNKRVISCSTVELNSLSDREMESITQSITLTNNIIQNWLETIRTDIDVLFRMTDSVVSMAAVMCSILTDKILGVVGYDYIFC